WELLPEEHWDRVCRSVALHPILCRSESLRESISQLYNESFRSSGGVRIVRSFVTRSQGKVHVLPQRFVSVEVADAMYEKDQGRLRIVLNDQLLEVDEGGPEIKAAGGLLLIVQI